MLNGMDLILIVMLAAAVIVAVRHIRKNHRQGKSCCGDCAGCPHSCYGKEGK